MKEWKAIVENEDVVGSLKTLNLQYCLPKPEELVIR